jgi:hypothetical protein
MPLGKYQDFASCHSAKMREGLSSEAADRYCGALEHNIYGSAYGSQKQKYALDNQMSSTEQVEQNAPVVEVEAAALTQIASAVIHTIDAIEAGNVTQENLDELGKAKEIISQVAEIQEEEAPPA